MSALAKTPNLAAAAVVHATPKKTTTTTSGVKRARVEAVGVETDAVDTDDGDRQASKKIKKLTHVQHILAKPGMYIGSCKVDSDDAYWVCNTSGKPTVTATKKKVAAAAAAAALDESEVAATPTVRMEYRKIGIAPGLYKLFDEILVNAADNKQRDTEKRKMTRLDVTLGATSVTVRNNGAGISTKRHDAYPELYIPELIFGELLTSSNYDDDVKQTVGGTNGLGAKLVNIYSTEFRVEIDDAVGGASYRQTWRNNMRDKEPARVTKFAGASNATSITFSPDFARFGMRDTPCFGRDLVDLFTRRVYDIAATTHKSLRVYLNGKAVDVGGFKEYMALYPVGAAAAAAAAAATPSTTAATVLDYVDEQKHWQVGVAVNQTGVFQQVSFVNSIATSRGGRHVDYVEELVADALLEAIKKKHKALKDAKPGDVKKHLFLFVNALVYNPTFDSQTKSHCTSTRADLQLHIDPTTKQQSRVKLVLPERFVKALARSDLVPLLAEKLEAKSLKALSKTDGKCKVRRLTGIPKLEDANWAGTPKGHLCTLVLTEGDSAKALAVSGLGVVGRDLYGVFPLKGKLVGNNLNVREASHAQIKDNAEVTAIKKILGLETGKQYTDAKQLRYGHVMIMADQDHDGSHIKGLILNLFSHAWPSLFRMPGFLEEFITPIVKVSRGISASGVVSARGSQELCFFTIPEYDAWTRRASATKGWTIKYYKGLGTSTAVEAKNYFSNLDRHRLAFAYRDAHDDDALELAFAKNKADARKAWLAALEPDTYLAHAPGVVIPYADFVHRELILFSDASNLRAIPSVVDGFKPGQRKVLFSAFKRNLQKEIKVAQLAGYVGEHSCYHHGEASLCGTIVGMAQNFCGSNNANLFLPNGQFGTRLQGGKDAASPRYIYTALSELARLAFPAADDAQLTYLTDDGQSIEPRYYVPVLPMVLVNGSAGIGTGWSSTVPNFDARVIVANLRAMIDADGDPAGALALPDLVPHYRGFIGCIVPLTTHSYATVGVVEMIGGGGGGASAALHITELPIGTWTSAYKEAVLEPMLLAGEIVEFREHHTDTRVSFVVDLTPEQMRAHTSAGLHKRFKLTSSLSTSNMVLFNAAGGLERYATANHVVRAFYPVRWRYYVERKRAQLAVARADERRLTNKVRFIREVNAGVIVVKHGKTELLAALTRGKYDSMPSPKKTPPLLPPQQTSDAMEEAEEEQEDDDTDMVDAAATGSAAAAAAVVAAPAKHFDYLLGMPIWSLTRERADALAAECARKQAEVRALESTTPADMWRADLDAFEAGLDALEARQAEQEKQAHARSIEKRVAQVKSVEARAKLRAELTRPVPVGAVVPYAAEPKLVARSASATAPARGGGGTGTGTGTTLAAVVPMSMDDEEEEHDISTIE